MSAFRKIGPAIGSLSAAISPVGAKGGALVSAFKEVLFIIAENGSGYDTADVVGSWVVPEDGLYLIHSVGSGGAGGFSRGAGGGGAGACLNIAYLRKGEVLTYTVAGQGIFGTSTSSPRADGRDTVVTVPGLISCRASGGTRGYGSTVGIGGAASGGDINAPGRNGMTPLVTTLGGVGGPAGNILGFNSTAIHGTVPAAAARSPGGDFGFGGGGSRLSGSSEWGGTGERGVLRVIQLGKKK